MYSHTHNISKNPHLVSGELIVNQDSGPIGIWKMRSLWSKMGVKFRTHPSSEFLPFISLSFWNWYSCPSLPFLNHFRWPFCFLLPIYLRNSLFYLPKREKWYHWKVYYFGSKIDRFFEVSVSEKWEIPLSLKVRKSKKRDIYTEIYNKHSKI